MISAIYKEHTHECITYTKIDDNRVKKCHYKNGQLRKEKVINVRQTHQYGRSHRNAQDFFEDMIWHHGYHENYIRYYCEEDK